MISARGQSRRRHDDDGFTLVELLAALFVFALISTAVVGMLLNSLATTRINRSRVAAANLAARELEITRATFESPVAGPRSIVTGQVTNPNPLPGGAVGSALVVDGVPYTVTRTAQWQSQGATAGPCDGGASGQLAYLRVTIRITWPKMRNVKAVTSSTLLTPPLGTYAAGTGHVKVKVVDGLNVAQSGQSVTITGPSGTSTQQTATDGCAFFAFLSPGNYVATVATSGYVDPTWNATPTTSVTVTANTVQSVGFTYAPASTLGVTFVTPVSGYNPPNTLALTAWNTTFPTTGHTKTLPGSGPARQFTTWPHPDGLILWAGDCVDADPQVHAGGVRSAPLTTAPGQATSGTVTGTAVDVVVQKPTGARLVNATVVATHVADSGCPGPVADPVSGGNVGQVLTLPVTTDSTGMTRVLLPYGTWTFKVIGQIADTTWTAATLAQSSAAPTSLVVTVK